MKAWMNCCLMLLGAGTVLGQSPEPATAPTKLRKATPVVKVRAGAVLVGEIGSPVALKELAGVPTVIEGVEPANLRSHRLLLPETGRQFKLDRSRYGGALGEALVSDRPLDLFNPFAPAELGNGARHLMRNPFTGRAEGWIVFSFRLPDRSAAKSFAKQRAKHHASFAFHSVPPTPPASTPPPPSR